MADIVDPATRSRMMSGIKGKNTKPEIFVRKALFREGFRFRLHEKSLSGKPDLVLKKYRAVIFVHGCFWHQHKGCKDASIPKSNVKFWKEKLHGNIIRDRKNLYSLNKAGWRVFVIWECQISRKRMEWLFRKIIDGKQSQGT